MRSSVKWVVLFYSMTVFSQIPKAMSHRYTNGLIDESSPYLLQHAHNPVDWFAWRPEVLEKARQENKLLLISIGYAACHWCHVMERECFEDEEVAQTMNFHFVNIKVDREERPDVDHIYMDALQMMTGQGGWPLNIVALPDGRPFWGATYVKKEQWIRALEQLARLYREDPDKIEEYATDLAKGIRQINLVTDEAAPGIMSGEELKTVIKDWYRRFDTKKGGYNRAPKFMMPGNLDFLLHYARVSQDKNIDDYVNTTLTSMAYGGIFDHIGGGFARYSVDTRWHVPHFEKMLYDNALLTSVYAKAYGQGGNKLYADVVRRTISFLESELMSEEGGFYSSLDADSLDDEGKLEEGAYYVWKQDELKIILEEDYPLFEDYYNINSYGHWEHGNYVLIRDAADAEIAQKHRISESDLRETLVRCRGLLSGERIKRSRPRLDDKILCSWNGLMLKGLTDAYRFLGDEKYLDLARQNAIFIKQNFIREKGGLFHTHKDGKSSISGYLEDYASLIDGFMGLYEVSYEEKWLLLAKELAEECLRDYYDNDSGLFFFSSKNEDFTIRRTLETADNVIPASNSMMCNNLFKLSRFFVESNFDKTAMRMTLQMHKRIIEHPESHANWLQGILFQSYPFYEIAVIGDEFSNKAKTFHNKYLPNSILTAAKEDGTIELLKNRYKQGSTLIYICENGSCKLPVESVEKAMQQLTVAK
ncbi:MAG: thioredoxin domain-containing protein [Flavobacteriaceae bacterium]